LCFHPHRRESQVDDISVRLAGLACHLPAGQLTFYTLLIESEENLSKLEFAGVFFLSLKLSGMFFRIWILESPGF
jgi:hypothetical protein